MCVASPRLTGKLEKRARSDRQVDARCVIAVERILELLGVVRCGLQWTALSATEFRIISQAP